MRTNRTGPWRRLATQRAARRRGTELHPPEAPVEAPLPLPPLESPDDDREFLPLARPDQGLRAEAA
jgi:hypothetical protein